jgi:alpha-tubulin suppressor-like RCC1 family protein
MLGIGGVAVMGDNAGEMGDNLPYAQLGGDFSVSRISIGSNHACAISVEKKVKCWGSGDFGRTGYGDVTLRGFLLTSMGSNLPYVDL